MPFVAADRTLFSRLYPALLHFVDKTFAVVPLGDEGEPEAVFAARDYLYTHRRAINSFVKANPHGFSPDDLAIISGWRRAIAGRFIVVRHLKRHSIFLGLEPPHDFYAVWSLFDRFEAVVGADLPVVARTALIPFRDTIIFDGVLTVEARPADLSAIREGVSGCYKYAREHGLILASIPEPRPRRTRGARKPKRRKAEH